MLAETNAILPGLGLTERDVVYAWAGVRPLTHDPSYPKGKRSREIHDLAGQGLPGVLAMTAGPVMTHRSAGREMTAAVRRTLPPSRPPQDPDYRPRRFPESPNSPPLLSRDPSIKLADLVQAVGAEHGHRLADILIARTGVGYAHRLTAEEIRRAAEAVSVQAGWDRETTTRQIALCSRVWPNLYQPPGQGGKLRPLQILQAHARDRLHGLADRRRQPKTPAELKLGL